MQVKVKAEVKKKPFTILPDHILFSLNLDLNLNLNLSLNLICYYFSFQIIWKELSPLGRKGTSCNFLL
jgi:hypothetical protein